MSEHQAKTFFLRASAMAAEGHFEYAIDLFLDGLRLDADNVEAHRALREASLRRKAAGGNDLAMLQKVKLRKVGDNAVEDLLNTEKLLAYDPANVNWMLAAANHANRANLVATTQWLLRLCEAASKSRPPT